MTTTERRTHAARVILTAAGQWGDLWNLAGAANATRRQSVMMALTGETLPKAKCGVTALEARAFELFAPDCTNCNCRSSDRAALTAAIRAAA